MRIGFSSNELKRIQYNAWLLTHKQFPEVMSHVETIKEEQQLQNIHPAL